jgi:hypothetical protein
LAVGVGNSNLRHTIDQLTNLFNDLYTVVNNIGRAGRSVPSFAKNLVQSGQAFFSVVRSYLVKLPEIFTHINRWAKTTGLSSFLLYPRETQINWDGGVVPDMFRPVARSYASLAGAFLCSEVSEYKGTHSPDINHLLGSYVERIRFFKIALYHRFLLTARTFPGYAQLMRRSRLKTSFPSDEGLCGMWLDNMKKSDAGEYSNIALIDNIPNVGVPPNIIAGVHIYGAYGANWHNNNWFTAVVRTYSYMFDRMLNRVEDFQNNVQVVGYVVTHNPDEILVDRFYTMYGMVTEDIPAIGGFNQNIINLNMAINTYPGLDAANPPLALPFANVRDFNVVRIENYVGSIEAMFNSLMNRFENNGEDFIILQPTYTDPYYAKSITKQDVELPYNFSTQFGEAEALTPLYNTKPLKIPLFPTDQINVALASFQKVPAFRPTVVPLLQVALAPNWYGRIRRFLTTRLRSIVTPAEHNALLNSTYAVSLKSKANFNVTIVDL